MRGLSQGGGSRHSVCATGVADFKDSSEICSAFHVPAKSLAGLEVSSCELLPYWRVTAVCPGGESHMQATKSPHYFDTGYWIDDYRQH